MLTEILREARVIVTVGSGGVGKTTISAAMGLAAALDGQRVLVMTIDPARRLANALGFADLSGEECEIDPALWAPPGDEAPKGQLFAMMLDQKIAFDRLVERFAPSPESAERIRSNGWYQQMSTALAGAQEYMAVERLHEMSKMRDYDLIVLDTPPTSNALDFLEAPERIKGILQMRSFQWLQDKVTQEGSRAGKLMRWGGSALLKLLGRVTGQEVMQEIWRLLEDLSVLYESFQEHADHTWALLQSEQSRFVQVSVAQQRPLTEALFLQQKLLADGMHVEGFVLNRVPGYLQHQGEWTPLPDEPIEQSPDTLQTIAQRVAAVSQQPAEEVASLAEQLGAHLQEFRAQSELAEEAVVFLREQAEGDPWIHLIPRIHDDISDLEGLQHITRLLRDPSFNLTS